jgi:hypothetical protein
MISPKFGIAPGFSTCWYVTDPMPIRPNYTSLKLIVVKVAIRHCVHAFARAASMRLPPGGQLSRIDCKPILLAAGGFIEETLQNRRGTWICSKTSVGNAAEGAVLIAPVEFGANQDRLAE